MPLSKTQKKVLKKIDAAYAKMERLSGRQGFPIIEEIAFGFQFPDISYDERKKVNDQNKSRKQLFEKAAHRKEIAL